MNADHATRGGAEEHLLGGFIIILYWHALAPFSTFYYLIATCHSVLEDDPYKTFWLRSITNWVVIYVFRVIIRKRSL